MVYGLSTWHAERRQDLEISNDLGGETLNTWENLQNLAQLSAVVQLVVLGRDKVSLTI